MEEKNKTFSYTYSATTDEERREIEEIRRRYADGGQMSKLERMRELNAKVYRLPKIFEGVAIVFGILAFGLGLTMILSWNLTVGGSLVCLFACVVLGVTHAIYKILLKRNKNRYREEILKLSDELLNGDKEDKEDNV